MKAIRYASYSPMACGSVAIPDGCHVYDGFQLSLATYPVLYPAQASACRLAASHAPVLHGRCTARTTLLCCMCCCLSCMGPENAKMQKNYPVPAKPCFPGATLRIWRQSSQPFSGYKRTNRHCTMGSCIILDGQYSSNTRVLKKVK